MQAIFLGLASMVLKTAGGADIKTMMPRPYEFCEVNLLQPSCSLRLLTSLLLDGGSSVRHQAFQQDALGQQYEEQNFVYPGQADLP